MVGGKRREMGLGGYPAIPLTPSTAALSRYFYLVDRDWIRQRIPVPFSIKGEWRIDVQPGMHPSFTRDQIDVRIVSFDAQTGSIAGEVDHYMHTSHCGLGAKFSGPFDGT
jgi:hypothetical protein